MDGTKRKQILGFLITVTMFHVITYFIFGFIASSLFKYKELFELPVIKEYYKEFGSVSTLLGPIIQVLRGLIFGLVLLPIRKLIEESKYCWLIIWGLFIGIGILGTPAAAPSSIEGIVYSRLPLWFHLIGFPEILLQSLVFSLLIHNKYNRRKLISSNIAKEILQAFTTACISFIGYTLVSIAFAVLAGANIGESGANIKVLGQFILPLALSFSVALVKPRGLFLAKHVALYVLSMASLLLYQIILLGDGNIVYAIIAPILPVIISMLLLKPKKEEAAASA